jgi:hypothetical protein
MEDQLKSRERFRIPFRLGCFESLFGKENILIAAKTNVLNKCSLGIGLF